MKAASSELQTALFLVILSLVILAADLIGFLDLPKSFLSSVTSPIQYGLYKSYQQVLWKIEPLWEIKNAVLENRALKGQLNEVLIENSALRKKLTEKNIGIDQENTLSSQTFNLLTAHVLGQSRFLIVNKGSLDGAKTGQAVVFKDNLVGKIKKVEEKRSWVILPSDPDSKLGVFSQGEVDRAKGLLVSEFGSRLLMDKILHQEKIKKGDLVYSEGDEEIPRGLLLGQISEVLEKPNEVFKKAYVEPLFRVIDLDMVYIIRGP